MEGLRDWFLAWGFENWNAEKPRIPKNDVAVFVESRVRHLASLRD